MIQQQDKEVEMSKFEEMMLIDDCCDEILRRLPLDDLCALSLTCTLLHRLCSKQFRKEYTHKVMSFQSVKRGIRGIIVKDGILIKEPSDEKYITCFKKSIQSIIICGTKYYHGGEDGLPKLKAINALYSENEEMKSIVKQVCFKDWSDFRIERGIALADVLKFAETIIIDSNIEYDNLYDSILQRAPNMKRLTFWDKMCRNTTFDWLQKRYINLEILEMYISNLPDAGVIKSFLELNPNVQRFAHYTNNKNYISKLMAEHVRVDEMLYHLDQHTNIIENLKVLNSLCTVQNVKLHLTIGSTYSVGKSALLSELVLLKPHIVGFYIENNINEQVIDAMNEAHMLDNVQFLRIAMPFFYKKKEEICLKMSNLIEIYFDLIDTNIFHQFHQTMLTIVGQSFKLTKMFLHKLYKVIISHIDFEALNQARMKLKIAAPLKIYIGDDSDAYKFPRNNIKRPFECIEIIRASSELFSNPMFQQTGINH